MTKQDKTPMDAETQGVTPIHKSIAAALARAQSEMGKALKSAENPAFKRDGKKSMYADLASVADACMPSLTRHGIAVIQPTFDDETGRYVKTILIHGETGETLECRVPLIVQKNDMQGYGSAVTYARRYGLMGMAGIAPDDDDGNAAAEAAPKDERYTTPVVKPVDAAPFKIGILRDLNSARTLDAITNIENHPKFKADMVKLRAMSGDAALEVEERLEEIKAELTPRETVSKEVDPYAGAVR